MAAPVKPEVVEGEKPAEGSPTPNTPNTNQEPVTPLIDQAAILGEMRKLAEDNRKLNARIEELSKPAAVDPKLANDQFWKSPATALQEATDKITAQLTETVRPLIDFKNRMEASDTYTTLKTRIKASNPKIAEFLSDPGAEAALDQILKGRPTINEQDIIGGIAGVAGAMQLGMIPGAAPKANGTPVSTAKVDVTTLPPHLRPSAAPGPTREADPNKPERELTENERRLARESNMTEVEFLSLQKMHPLDVIKPKPAPKKEAK